MDPLESVVDPFRQPEFLDGALVGIAALLVACIIGVGTRIRTGRPAPIAGLAIASAALIALDPIRPVSAALVVGVVAVALAGALLDLARVPLWVAAAASVPGAYLVATSEGVSSRDSIGAITLAAVVLGGMCAASFDDRWRRTAVTPAMTAVTAGAVYSTVPDTEAALVLLGVSAVVAVGGWPLRLVRLGAAGAFATVAVFAWAIAVDGIGRDGAIVGAVCSLGLLVVDPVVGAVDRARTSRSRRAPRRTWTDRATATVVLGLAAHAAIALSMARIAGLQAGVAPAAARAAAVFVVALALWTFIRRRLPDPGAGPKVDVSLVDRRRAG